MTREKYESLSLSVLRELAKSRNLKGVSALRKEALIERMLEEDEKAGSTEKNAAGIEKNAGDADKDRASERTVDSSVEENRSEKQEFAQERKGYREENM